MYQPQTNVLFKSATSIIAIGLAIWFLKEIKPILAPFVFAAVLAYILQPIVKKLSQKMSRASASMLVMLGVFLLIITLAVIIIPVLVSQIHALLSQVPQFISWLEKTVIPNINNMFHTNYSLNSEFIRQFVDENNNAISAALKKLTPAIARQGGHLVGFTANVMLLPFLLYYFLLDWERWVSNFKKLIPLKYKEYSIKIMTELDAVLSEWLRGQLAVVLIMGAIYSLGLTIIGLNNGLAIGVIAGALVFVPYLGAFTGLLLATLAALLQFGNITGLLMVWSVFAIGQFLESFIITPKIIGEKIGLSPLAVIFSLAAFGQLMGFIGMLLALPLAAVCMVLFREVMEFYFNSSFYRN